MRQSYGEVILEQERREKSKRIRMILIIGLFILIIAAGTVAALYLLNKDSVQNVAGNNEAIIPANELTDSYWVEHLVIETGTGTENSVTGVNLEFIARSGTTDLYSSQVKFYPFTLLVIILGGEDQIPSDPASIEHGMFRFAVDRYRDWCHRSKKFDLDP
jgi:hypothetical protein